MVYVSCAICSFIIFVLRNFCCVIIVLKDFVLCNIFSFVIIKVAMTGIKYYIKLWHPRELTAHKGWCRLGVSNQGWWHLREVTVHKGWCRLMAIIKSGDIPGNWEPTRVGVDLEASKDWCRLNVATCPSVDMFGTNNNGPKLTS